MSPEYLAGLFDGEGSAGLYHGRKTYPGYCPALNITGSYKPTILELRAKFGGHMKMGTPRAGGRRKNVWVWDLRSKDAVRGFLLTVLPHLREKREQAVTMLGALDLPAKDRKVAAELLVALKKINWE